MLKRIRELLFGCKHDLDSTAEFAERIGNGKKRVVMCRKCGKFKVFNNY